MTDLKEIAAALVSLGKIVLEVEVAKSSGTDYPLQQVNEADRILDWIEKGGLEHIKVRLTTILKDVRRKITIIDPIDEKKAPRIMTVRPRESSIAIADLIASQHGLPKGVYALYAGGEELSDDEQRRLSMVFGEWQDGDVVQLGLRTYPISFFDLEPPYSDGVLTGITSTSTIKDLRAGISALTGVPVESIQLWIDWQLVPFTLDNINALEATKYGSLQLTYNNLANEEQPEQPAELYEDLGPTILPLPSTGVSPMSMSPPSGL
ncbi:Hypothetical protein POVN_LOCUS384 [uncultured virus]|nr:Hypothetical protein POVN_LOCUS384 [uncultured virus]